MISVPIAWRGSARRGYLASPVPWCLFDLTGSTPNLLILFVSNWEGIITWLCWRRLLEKVRRLKDINVEIKSEKYGFRLNRTYFGHVCIFIFSQIAMEQSHTEAYLGFCFSYTLKILLQLHHWGNAGLFTFRHGLKKMVLEKRENTCLEVLQMTDQWQWLVTPDIENFP